MMNMHQTRIPGRLFWTVQPLAACALFLAGCATTQTASVPTPPGMPSTSVSIPSPSSPTQTSSSSQGQPSSSASTAQTDTRSESQSDASSSTQEPGGASQSGQIPGETAGDPGQTAARTASAADSPQAPGGEGTLGQEGGTEQGERGAGGAKTDDEILAEALEQFGRTGTEVTGDGERTGAGGSTGDLDALAGTGTGLGEEPRSQGSGESPEGAADREPGTATDKPESLARAGTGNGPDKGSPEAAGTPGGGSLTEAERKRMLENELERGFADFDELMMSEREVVAQQRNASAGSGSTYDESGALGGEGDGQGLPQTAMAQPRMPQSTAGSQTGVPGTGSSDIATQVPPDIGSAEDDDIIARQLREAAMKEQDPALREKLWDEYRKYKRGG